MRRKEAANWKGIRYKCWGVNLPDIRVETECGDEGESPPQCEGGVRTQFMGDYTVDDFHIWLSQPSTRLNQLKGTSSNGISNPPLPSQLNNPPSWLALPSCVPLLFLLLLN